MRIALCEDNVDDAASVIHILQGHHVTHYRNGDQLWFQYQDHHRPYDLMIFDIEMPGELNGLATAAKIRQDGDEVAMILLTSYDKYAVAGYDIHPHCYLLKPVAADQLLARVGEIRELLQRQCQSSLLLTTKTGSYKVSLSSVIYLESDMHYTNIHTYDREQPYRVRCKLSDIDLQGDERFVAPHKSYIINADRIAAISNRNYEIVLDSGTIVPISKYKKKSFAQALARYETQH